MSILAFEGVACDFVFFSGFQAFADFTYVSESHFLGIIHTGNSNFTLRHKVIVIDIVRQKTFLWQGEKKNNVR